ncbi:uncharacterized protein LOC131683156 [Topomyia yanbarensis]|uniref:uncharacterized protein LOC131683156 n=1 Tax=Topomyia yanbarensis TaxID=2498891 RepID=UPI00273A7E67|nr:uncharacterized protein LOC131683156 [Topomyia yanbarensis]XP_058820971.1 uncharacterized protein LOC131683156 [Topomyia yanbarensis]
MNPAHCLMLLIVATATFAFPQSEVIAAVQDPVSVPEQLAEQQTAAEQPVQVPADLAQIVEQPSNGGEEEAARRKRQFEEIDIEIVNVNRGGPGFNGGYPGNGGYGGYENYGNGGFPPRHHHHHRERW